MVQLAGNMCDVHHPRHANTVTNRSPTAIDYNSSTDQHSA